LVATIGGARRTVDFAAGDDLLPKLSSGDKLTVDMWHGTVAAVSAHGKRSESLDSPSSELHRDKAIPLAFLAVAMICVPLALISILSEPSRQIGGRPPALFATIFSPLAGVVLLALAGGLADGHVVAITLAVTLWTAVGVLSAMVARSARSQGRQRRTEIDTAVLKAVSRRRGLRQR